MNNKNKLVFRFNNFLMNIEVDNNNILSIYYINDKKNIHLKMIEVDITTQQFLHKEEKIKNYIDEQDLKDYIILSMFIPSLTSDLKSVSYMSKNAPYELLLKIMLEINSGKGISSSDELMSFIREGVGKDKKRFQGKEEENKEWGEDDCSPTYKA